MAKQYISKNNEFYLKDKQYKKSISIPVLVFALAQWSKESNHNLQLDTQKKIKNLHAFLKTLNPLFAKEQCHFNNWNENMGNSNLTFVDKKTRTKLSNKEALELVLKSQRAYHLRICAGKDMIATDITYPFKQSSKFIKPSDPGPKSKPDMFEQMKNQPLAIDKIVAALKLLPEPMVDLVDVCVNNFNRGDYPIAPKNNPVEIQINTLAVVEALQQCKQQIIELSQDMASVVEDLSKEEFRLKDFKGRDLNSTEAFANQEAYYLFTEKGKGGFISFSRTRHNPPKYHWSISPAIDNAYLFQSPLEDYKEELRGYLENPAQVFVDMKFKRVEAQRVAHPKIQAIQAVIDKKNLNEELENILTPTPQAILPETALAKKKSNKI